MTVEELIIKLEKYDKNYPVVIFDDNEGEYLSIKVRDDYISHDTSWARYSTHAVIIEAKDE